jgi:hypothetical protein
VGLGSLALLVGLFAAGSYYLDRYSFLDLTTRFEAPREPFPALEEAVVQYLRSFNPWALLRKGQVQGLWDQYQQACQKDFARLEHLRRAAPSQEGDVKIEANRRFRDACKDFSLSTLNLHTKIR